MGCNQLYLNNSGTRWTYKEKAPRYIIVVQTIDSPLDVKLRLCDSFESFGNWTAINFRFKGKRYSRLPSDYSTLEVNGKIRQVPVIVIT